MFKLINFISLLEHFQPGDVPLLKNQEPHVFASYS